MGNVKTFGGRPLVSAETSTVDLSKEQPAGEYQFIRCQCISLH